ncbi:MAG: AcrR family transcriptional regulator [Candidatus Paceibacteria bacterium]|jgi:AcrR family transcriptional regulator
MRVSQASKQNTRQAILYAAKAQFLAAGYESATTRDIASLAGIAAGTLFNYFPSKQALGLALVAEANEEARAEFDRNHRLGESLEERLFAHIAIQLRHFSPVRSWIREILHTALNPLLKKGASDTASALRDAHLERVSKWLAAEPGIKTGCAQTAVDLHLYWSLYLGVLSFWAHDDSDNQDATLAFLDRSVGLFCHALSEESGHPR